MKYPSMKTLMFAVSLVGLLAVTGRASQEAVSFNLTTTNTIAATSTNLTKWTAYSFGQKIPQTLAIYARASGSSAGSSGNVTVWLEVNNGTNWTTALLGNVKVVVPVSGVATNTIPEWFVTPGWQQIRVGAIDSTVTNAANQLQVWGTYTFTP